MKNFNEFKQHWQQEVGQNNTHLKQFKSKSHMVFVVVYPDTWPWNFAVEKQTQTTVLQTSGGNTGAGTGHHQKLCYQSELDTVLKGCHNHTHAMIVSVGMVFDMTAKRLPITRFYEFADSGDYCKGHIIAKEGQPAFLHHQHIELNLKTWRELGTPSVWEKWEDFKRSPDNFHDDYTPPWITPKGRPTINNFSQEERQAKAWSYAHMENNKPRQRDNWLKMQRMEPKWRESIDTTNNYFNILMNRMREKFYAENTEQLGKLPKENFDLIFTPTAGYSGEVFADKLDFDGDVVFFDYCSENIDIKQNIVEMNMSIDEIKQYQKISEHAILLNDRAWTLDELDNFEQLDHHTFQTKYDHYREALLKSRAATYGTREQLRSLQKKMYDTYNIEYWLMDIIGTLRYKSENARYKQQTDLVDKIKGKRVFFDVSNIFGYHVSHACYTLDELVNSFNTLEALLKTHTEHYYIRGTRPGKKNLHT